jgi:hypothetical protein
MKKLKYKTEYLKRFLLELTKYDAEVSKQLDSITIKASSKQVIYDIQDLLELLNMPLTYQVEGIGDILTVFDPRV